MKLYMIMVFMLGVVGLAWAPSADPHGYWHSTLDIEYNNALTTSRQATYDAMIQGIQARHVERRNLDRLWMVIPQEYRSFIRDLNLNLDPRLIYALVYYESWWTPKAIGYNPNGTMDLGIMQLNNRYVNYFVAAHYTGEAKFDVFNPRHNLEVGLKHFQSLLEYFNNDIGQAIAAYNAGRYRVEHGRTPASTIAYRSRILSKASHGHKVI